MGQLTFDSGRVREEQDSELNQAEMCARPLCSLPLIGPSPLQSVA